MNYVKTLTVAERKDEIRNSSQVIFTIYNAPGGFVYSINCKLGRFVRSYYPTPKEKKFATKKEAQAAAVAKVRSWIADSRAAKERLRDFDFVNYQQPSLFDDLD